LIAFIGSAVRAAGSEIGTLDSATEVIMALSEIPLRGIPPILMQDAKAIIIVPNVIKAGLVVGGRHGNGVALIREPDGGWSYPLFVSLSGGSVGWQIGVQSTDVVLIFKNKSALDRLLKGKGKLTLGADVAVAAGPVGRQAEAGTDGQLKAEIYSYSRSRGLFAGVSLEGAVLLNDTKGNEALANVLAGRAVDVRATAVLQAADRLRLELVKLSGVPVAPPVVVPEPIVPVPPPPVYPMPVPPPPPPSSVPLPPPTPVPGR
jgi:lipid-binding SYLF domain-containing protein